MEAVDIQSFADPTVLMEVRQPHSSISIECIGSIVVVLRRSVVQSLRSKRPPVCRVVTPRIDSEVHPVDPGEGLVEVEEEVVVLQ